MLALHITDKAFTGNKLAYGYYWVRKFADQEPDEAARDGEHYYSDQSTGELCRLTLAP